MGRILVLLALLLLPIQSWATTTHVQLNHVRDVDANATVSVSTPGNVTTGNAVAGAISWLPTTSNITGVTVCGNTATLSTGGTVSQGTNISGRGFYYLNVTTGACTVTATFDAGVTDARMVIHELSGEDTAGTVLSACNAQLNPGAGTDAITSTTVSIVSTGDYVFGFTSEKGGVASTPGTGFTQGVDSTTRESEYIANYGSSGNTAATFTGGNGSWVTCIVSFPVAGGAAPNTDFFRRRLQQ